MFLGCRSRIGADFFVSKNLSYSFIELYIDNTRILGYHEETYLPLFFGQIKIFLSKVNLLPKEDLFWEIELFTKLYFDNELDSKHYFNKLSLGESFDNVSLFCSRLHDDLGMLIINYIYNEFYNQMGVLYLLEKDLISFAEFYDTSTRSIVNASAK